MCFCIRLAHGRLNGRRFTLVPRYVETIELAARIQIPWYIPSKVFILLREPTSGLVTPRSENLCSYGSLTPRHCLREPHHKRE